MSKLDERIRIMRKELDKIAQESEIRNKEKQSYNFVAMYSNYLIQKTEMFHEIANTWVAIEEYGTRENVDNFYTIVQDIMGGGSNE